MSNLLGEVHGTKQTIDHLIIKITENKIYQTPNHDTNKPNNTRRGISTMRNTAAITMIASMLFSGCSAFIPKTQTISVNCSEQDALLQINGQPYNGSAQTEVRRNKSVAIVCEKPGYHTTQKTIDYSLSGTGVADIIGTVIFLLPVVGLITPGAFTLDETSITVSMVKDSSQTL